MATGTASGGSCYETQADAARMFCSGFGGVTGAGVVTCSDVAGVSTVAGGPVSASLTFRTQPTSGPATSVVGAVQFQRCETYGLDYWAPYQAAWIALVLVIATGRTVIKRFFVHNAA